LLPSWKALPNQGLTLVGYFDHLTLVRYFDQMTSAIIVPLKP
jgi:hypothetical protein